MKRSIDHLYDLLPAIYRIRDAEQGHPLRALLRVINEQVGVVEDNVAQLYDNWFIETCEAWVVPYLGDLVGFRPSEIPAGRDGEGVQSQLLAKALAPRREVANTLRYRRRKGSLALLELLARDVAAWPARAVEYYARLACTQHLNHLQPGRGGTLDLRRGDVLDRLDGAFDGAAHTVDVRRVSSGRSRGRYNIPSLGLHVWRLQAYSVTHAPACCLEEGGRANTYAFSVLGNDVPLFTLPRPESEPTQIAGPLHVPAPISRRALQQRQRTPGGEMCVTASSDYYGQGKSLLIWAPDWPRKGAPQPLPRNAIIPADLGDWHYAPHGGHVAVDPERGRMAFPVGQTPQHGVYVSYHYGFSAELGGGEYPRSIPGPTPVGVARLRAADVLDAKKLARRIAFGTDDFTSYLFARFSEEHRQLLQGAMSSAEEVAKIFEALLDEFNGLLADEELAEHAQDQSLSDEAKKLLATAPQGNMRRRLNRLVLEAEYDGLIASSYKLYRVGRQQVFSTIAQALGRWRHEQPRHAVIEVTDNAEYTEPLSIKLQAHQSLQLQAANQRRPILRVLDQKIEKPDTIEVSGAQGSRFVLDGFLVTGRGIRFSTHVPSGAMVPTKDGLCEVLIRHCTLVPGWGRHCDGEPKSPQRPSLELVHTGAKLQIAHSIVGAIRVQCHSREVDASTIVISDSIVDATQVDGQALCEAHGGVARVHLEIRRSTVFGEVCVHAIPYAENSIFTGAVTVARQQLGCMRFCYVPRGSRTPQRFACQPDAVVNAHSEQAEIEAERVRPRFHSTRYGNPTYAQLADACAAEIRRGASDEAEMGVFHDLYQPQREANLRRRLEEYVPAGMDVGILFAT